MVKVPDQKGRKAEQAKAMVLRDERRKMALKANMARRKAQAHERSDLEKRLGGQEPVKNNNKSE